MIPVIIVPRLVVMLRITRAFRDHALAMRLHDVVKIGQPQCEQQERAEFVA